MIDLINHDYVRRIPKEEHIVAEDPLTQSFASSQSYLTRNKVINKTSMSPEVSNITNQQEKAEEKHLENDFAKEVD